MKFIIVDDEEVIRDSLCGFLTMKDHSCRVASNGKEALELIDNEMVDVAISDINMPYMNGIELLKIIRSKYPEIKVILLTGYANEENAMNAENLGVYAFLSKSLDMFKLVKIINRLEQEQEGLKNFRLNPVRTGASRLPIGVGGFIKG